MPVDYDCTSEASEEEWNDDSRDDDATTDSPEERQRQKQVAISRLIKGPHTLLAEPTSAEIHKGLMSSKLHRAAGQDGITAELIRAAMPWLIALITLIWQWTVACSHVAQSWKDGMIITLCKKLDPSKAVNYRGITFHAVLGKCLSTFLYVD